MGDFVCFYFSSVESRRAHHFNVSFSHSISYQCKKSSDELFPETHEFPWTKIHVFHTQRETKIPNDTRNIVLLLHTQCVNKKFRIKLSPFLTRFNYSSGVF